MTTLEDKLNELDPVRRAKVEARALELIDQEKTRQDKSSRPRRYVIFDLEATCWDYKNEKGERVSWNDPTPASLEVGSPEWKQRNEMEVIEIGAVKTDANFNVIDEFDVFVKPILNPILTDFCKNLTTITQKDVDSGLEFRSAMKRFVDWADDPTLYMAWGDYDLKQLEADCHRSCFKCIGSDKYMNAKTVVKFLSGTQGVGMGRQVEKLKIPFEGTPHRGIDDARMVATVLRTLHQKR